jgi:hypothetical protein
MQATTIPIMSVAAFTTISYFGQHTPQFEGFDPLLLSGVGTAGVTGEFELSNAMTIRKLWITHACLSLSFLLSLNSLGIPNWSSTWLTNVEAHSSKDIEPH